jgi:hypothetical protein
MPEVEQQLHANVQRLFEKDLSRWFIDIFAEKMGPVFSGQFDTNR